ncbi:AI-2E family transporter [Lentibacillus sp. CBA3610]|uniref:AI-2E family transporter n=1 Tax=Lentibacillus sp. CBA3610 TaxID=2518176 RepID=UPI00350E55E3
MQKRWFQFLIVLILVFLLILLIRAADFLFDPIFTYVGAVAFPIIGSGVLFYLSRPLMHLLEKLKLHRIVAIIGVFLILAAAVYIVARYIVPILETQFSNLINNIPTMVSGIQDLIAYWQSNQNLIPDEINETINNLTSNLQSYIEMAMSFIFGFIGEFISIIFALILIPFFLFFMLKDGEKFVPFITQFFEKKKADNIRSLLSKIDETLTSFIQGQLIVALCIGILLYLGYLMIGLNYALTLAMFGAIICVIPFIGPYIAVIPGMIVGLFQDPLMPIWVAIIMIVAQQIEGNLVSPNVMGKALHLHPLTVITVVLAAGSIGGFLGMLFAIPFYAVVKTIISHFYETYQDAQRDEKDALI